MKKILLIISVLTATLTHGQITFDKFDELVINDYGNLLGKTFSGYSYLIKLKEDPLRICSRQVLRGVDLLGKLKIDDYDRYQKIQSLALDSIQRYKEEMDKLKLEFHPEEKIDTIDKELIRKLEIEMIPTSRKEILHGLMITKDSIHKNLENYISLFLERRKIKFKNDGLSYCKGKLDDFSLFEKTAATMTNGSGTDVYRTVSIELRSKTDTLNIFTHGQYPFMLPWSDEKGKAFSYNVNLSKAIGQLLPEKEHSNRHSLLADTGLFRDFYIEQLYFKTIEDNCINGKNKLIVK